jgi:hypothetical protein
VAYTTATIFPGDVTVNADGGVTAVVTFEGNAGETPRRFAYSVNSVAAAGGNWLRAQAMDRIATLNSNISVVTSLTLPKVLDVTTPIPEPAATSGSYLAASAPFTPGATPQDVFGIGGSATRLITVTGLWLTTVQTTAGSNAWFVVKRSTLNTGGTSTAVTMVPTSVNAPAPTAAVRQYTANPTAGTLVGNVWSGRVSAPAPATAALSPYATQIFGGDRRTIVLATVNDLLALNFNGAALPAGLSVQAVIAWDESV